MTLFKEGLDSDARMMNGKICRSAAAVIHPSVFRVVTRLGDRLSNPINVSVPRAAWALYSELKQQEPKFHHQLNDAPPFPLPLHDWIGTNKECGEEVTLVENYHTL